MEGMAMGKERAIVAMIEGWAVGILLRSVPEQLHSPAAPRHHGQKAKTAARMHRGAPSPSLTESAPPLITWHSPVSACLAWLASDWVELSAIHVNELRHEGAGVEGGGGRGEDGEVKREQHGEQRHPRSLVTAAHRSCHS